MCITSNDERQVVERSLAFVFDKSSYDFASKWRLLRIECCDDVAPVYHFNSQQAPVITNSVSEIEN